MIADFNGLLARRAAPFPGATWAHFYCNDIFAFSR